MGDHHDPAGRAGIHDEHPFATPREERDPVRRFRGRLAAPVTIVTSGSGSGRTGLTISSLVVAEGEPGVAVMLVGPTTDLWFALEETGRAVVHVAREGNRALSARFAGLAPSPGGLFAGLDVAQGEWGPEIAGLSNRLYCTRVGAVETGYLLVVSLAIDRIEVDDLTDPLAYFRGSYRRLARP